MPILPPYAADVLLQLDETDNPVRIMCLEYVSKGKCGLDSPSKRIGIDGLCAYHKWKSV